MSATYPDRMPLSLLVIPIVTVVLAASLSFFFGRLGASSEGKRAHERWLREQRFEAYKAFLATADKWATRAKGSDADGEWEPEQEFYDEMTAAESAVELLGPPEVVEAMDPIRSALLHLQEVRTPGGPSASQKYWDRQRAFVHAAQQQMDPTTRSKAVR
ncbi:hypothetical protein BFL35_16250 (plasmid) [Clavibacter michiganensis]|nr:hypothetical protein BFL35_16250 [Clavibacter michiganensis]